MTEGPKAGEARVGVDDEGLRLDVFLTGCPGIRSRNVAQGLIDAKKVSVDGRAKTKNYHLCLGELITYESPAESPVTIGPEDISISTVYEDDDVIVVDKPPGMVVHPGAGNYSGTLVNALLAHTELASPGAPMRPGIVHRLDKGTSGLLVVAKTDMAYFSLVDQLKSRQVNREYLALVEGGFSDTDGRIEAPIRRHPKERLMMTVGGQGAKEAITEFQVLAAAHGLSLLKVKLETGRTHQIRVHMKFIRHPIACDPVYGTGASVLTLGLNRPWLHARRLSFCHPRDGRALEFMAPLPPDLSLALEKAEIVWE